jgi:P pilus assembly chaperone PapD
MEIAQIVQIVTALTALVAVVVGPIVSIYVARRQIRASVVSNNRQQWIDNLRDTIADFLAKQLMVRSLSRQAHADESSIPRIEDVLRLVNKIELLVNPMEQDHAELVQLVCELGDAMNQEKEKNKSFDVDPHVKRIVALSQAILKREWERVKRGD